MSRNVWKCIDLKDELFVRKTLFVVELPNLAETSEVHWENKMKRTGFKYGNFEMII